MNENRENKIKELQNAQSFLGKLRFSIVRLEAIGLNGDLEKSIVQNIYQQLSLVKENLNMLSLNLNIEEEKEKPEQKLKNSPQKGFRR